MLLVSIISVYTIREPSIKSFVLMFSVDGLSIRRLIIDGDYIYLYTTIVKLSIPDTHGTWIKCNRCPHFSSGFVLYKIYINWVILKCS